MPITATKGELFAVHRDGVKTLIGSVDGMSVQVEPTTGRAACHYFSGRGFVRTTCRVRFDIPERRFFVWLTSLQLATLRFQAKRKGRPGWKHIKGPKNV